MAQIESRLSRKIMDAIRLEPGTFCFKVHGSEHVMAGLPDIIGVVDGWFFGMEVKVPGKRNNTSKVQDYVHAKISRAGGQVAVICSVDEALAFLETVRAHEKR